MTYYSDIIELLQKLVLENKYIVTIDVILQNLNLPNYKLHYVINALKKGIEQNQIEMIINPDCKNKYYGHQYKLIL